MTQLHVADALQSQPHPTKEQHQAQQTLRKRSEVCQLKSLSQNSSFTLQPTASEEVKPLPSKPLNHPHTLHSFAWQSAVFASLIWWSRLQTKVYAAHDRWNEAGGWHCNSYRLNLKAKSVQKATASSPQSCHKAVHQWLTATDTTEPLIGCVLKQRAKWGLQSQPEHGEDLMRTWFISKCQKWWNGKRRACSSWDESTLGNSSVPDKSR